MVIQVSQPTTPGHSNTKCFVWSGHPSHHLCSLVASVVAVQPETANRGKTCTQQRSHGMSTTVLPESYQVWFMMIRSQT